MHTLEQLADHVFSLLVFSSQDLLLTVHPMVSLREGKTIPPMNYIPVKGEGDYMCPTMNNIPELKLN